VGVELLLRRDPHKVGFRRLLEDRSEIEAITDCVLEWMELPGKQSSRIVAFLPNVDAFDEGQWSALQSWMLDMMQKMHLAFASRIKALDMSAIEEEPEVSVEQQAP
jgi:hypothetical protein